MDQHLFYTQIINNIQIIQMNAEILCPTIRWAQKGQTVYLTVMLRDIKKEKTKITSNSVYFSGQSNNKQYQFTLQLFQEVDEQKSKTFVNGSNLRYELIKKQNKKWPRLAKDKSKLSHILIDWDRWDQQSQQSQKQQNFSDNEDKDNILSSQQQNIMNNQYEEVDDAYQNQRDRENQYRDDRDDNFQDNLDRPDEQNNSNDRFQDD